MSVCRSRSMDGPWRILLLLEKQSLGFAVVDIGEGLSYLSRLKKRKAEGKKGQRENQQCNLIVREYSVFCFFFLAINCPFLR